MIEQDFCKKGRHLRRKFQEYTCTEIPPRLISQPGQEKQDKWMVGVKRSKLEEHGTTMLNKQAVLFLKPKLAFLLHHIRNA